MKILFYGDSITEMGRRYDDSCEAFNYGVGFPLFIAGELGSRNPDKYRIINRGVGGNKSVDLYSRLKADVWNHQPDVINILGGVNDLWHDIDLNIGVEIDRFERVFGWILKETKERLPNAKIIICEPFVLRGVNTQAQWEKFAALKDYAKVLEKLANEYGAHFLPLQEKFSDLAQKYGAEKYLYDGVHTTPVGAKLIADEWLKLFDEKIDIY